MDTRLGPGVERYPLHDAVFANDCSRIRSLVAGGYDIHARRRGVTPLHLAVVRSCLDSLQVLVDLGANIASELIDEEDKTKVYTPLSLALYDGDREVVGILLSNSPKTFLSAMNGSENFTKEDALQVFDGKITPLHIAAAFGNAKTVEALIAAGADPNALDGLDRSPLFNSATAPRGASAAAPLLAAGATVERMDGTGAGLGIVTAAMKSKNGIEFVKACQEKGVKATWKGEVAMYGVDDDNNLVFQRGEASGKIVSMPDYHVFHMKTGGASYSCSVM